MVWSLRVLGVIAVVLVFLISWPKSVSGTHQHVGNQGEIFRIPWIEGGNYNASRGPNNCVSGFCHGAGAVDFLPADSSDPNLWQQNFEGGYFMLWWKAECKVNVYAGPYLVYSRQGNASCSNGGGGSYPGYGSDGD